MTVIGRTINPILFQQFAAQVRALELGCQFINLGGVRTPADLSDANIAAVTAIYNAVTKESEAMQKLAEFDHANRDGKARYNQAARRNISNGFFGRRGKQAFTK